MPKAKSLKPSGEPSDVGFVDGDEEDMDTKIIESYEEMPYSGQDLKKLARKLTSLNNGSPAKS